VIELEKQRSASDPGYVCPASGLALIDMAWIEELTYVRRRVKRGDALFLANDQFASIYALRNGFFKTVQGLEDGREQVTGFQMSGEIMGMDGIDTGRYGSTALALEDSDVCVLPYALVANHSNRNDELQRQFHKVMSREIVREHGVMMLLGTMNAGERLAMFLLDLSRRFSARGYSASDFVLRMSRGDIGSYLAMKLETVSRAFTSLHNLGIVHVDGRHVQILDFADLERHRGQTSRRDRD
jgi:CRP/FNR family transcriptional regulator